MICIIAESEVAQSCLTLCNPMDCSPRGSSIRGIFQAGVLEWDAFAFSAGDANTLQKPVKPEYFIQASGPHRKMTSP